MAAGPPIPPPVPSPVSNGGASVSAASPGSRSRMNKPICSQCGNHARSRCPYESCKRCCANARNPCPIHVLNTNSTLQENLSSSPSTSAKTSSDVGNSLRASSVRHFSSNLTRFIENQSSSRSLSRKDAAMINKWKFSKLKAYNERNLQAEEEAFRRYMQNVSLLEKVFSVSTLTGERTPGEEGLPEEVTSGIKMKLKASRPQNESFREKMHALIDEGLKDLQRWETMDDSIFTKDSNEPKRQKKAQEWGTDSIAAVDELMKKLRNARTEDDLNSCIQMKSNLLNRTAVSLHGTDARDRSDSQVAGTDNSEGPLVPNLARPFNTLPKPFEMRNLDQEALVAIEQQFPSEERIIML